MNAFDFFGSSSSAVPGVVWTEKACATVYPDTFFPSSLRGVHAAQRICAGCPVLAECAELALRTDLVECVVASVWIPNPHNRPEIADIARRQLADVAASGEPAAPVSKERGPQDRTQRWNDPDFQSRVNALLDARMTWERIAVRLDCSVETARNAYKAAQAIKSSAQSEAAA
ncbi:WhiB family transcriptional regulator [Nocardia huaxiensis]|uniref:WhiB family transcriptional regulator n=1 Tax=Nocardia huaxiensis TaxID=2755382 RepID=A0A7D6VIT4_9NOCA|nr:WhiB family transcriptional regulator [Nocardia huaxiensis]QLY33995.1 WhiB family transcriptional regulator [Nocardia huaxiensis]UFS99102.1 WhiB family transcriptional regulator [Nocardia huaxiensis]